MPPKRHDCPRLRLPLLLLLPLPLPLRWNATAPFAPCFTTSIPGSRSTSLIAPAPPVTPHASSASSSPTKTRSALRASSSSTPGPSAASRHNPAR